MKKSVLFAIPALLFALAFSACGEEPASPAERCTVTVECDGARGTVSLTPLSEGNVYEKGTVVTAQIEPKSGFALTSVTLSGEALASPYTFSAEENCTLAVSFAVKGIVASFGEDYIGTWESLGGDSLTVSSRSVSLNGEEVPVLAASAEGYTLGTDGESLLKRTESLALDLGGTLYLKKDRPACALSEKVYGVYTADSERLELGALAFLCGEEGILLEDRSEGGTYDYFFVAGGKLVRLRGDGESFTLTREGVDTLFTSQSALPDLGVSFGAAWQGDWWEYGTDGRLHITATSLSCDGEVPSSALEDGEGNGYTVVFGAAHFSLRFFGLLSGAVIEMEGSGGPRYFISDRFEAGGVIEERYRKDWFAGESVLSVAERSIVFDGETAECYVDVGFVASVPDRDSSIQIGAHCYFFLVGGRMHFLFWYPNENVPAVDGVYYGDGSVEIDGELSGAWVWENADGTKTRIEIDAALGTVTIDGAAAVIEESYSGHVLEIVFGETRYELCADSVEGFLRLTEQDGSDFPVSRYFVKESLLGGAEIGEDLVGTWKSAGQDDLRLGKEGADWGEHSVKLLTCITDEERPYFRSYTFNVDGVRAQLDNYGAPAFQFTYNGMVLVFYREVAIDRESEGAIPAAMRGLFVDDTGVGAVLIEKDKITVWDSDDHGTVYEADDLTVTDTIVFPRTESSKDPDTGEVTTERVSVRLRISGNALQWSVNTSEGWTTVTTFNKKI